MDSDGETALTHETAKLHIDACTDDAGTRELLSPVLRVSRGQKEAHDITKEFISAAQGLGTGQLVKDDYFTLFEAVGALEIMDPKMDSGYLAPGDTLGDDYDVLCELLPEEVVGIMDQLLCAEVAWHTGHHISQTLFSSLYIDRLLWPEPKTLDQACFQRDGTPPHDNQMLHLVLRAYCLALIKACDLVHRTIISETYYEEEDFVSNLYNRKLLPDVDLVDVDAILDRGIWLIESKKDLLSEGVREALTCRLSFRKLFLRAVAVDLASSKEDHRFVWETCSSVLPLLLDSSKHGVAVPASFSTKTQRRLASTVPPRPIIVNGLRDTYKYLKQFFLDGKDATGICECERGSEILTFISIFEFRKPQPSVYIRCYLSSLIYSKMRVQDEVSFTQLIFDDLAEVVLPADHLVDRANQEVEVPLDPRSQIARKMDTFVARVGQSYLDMLRAVNMNRSRMRRMLCHTVMDWENVQLDTEELDIELQEFTYEKPIPGQFPNAEDVWAFPLSSWAYYHKLHQMEWIVQLGFELQIYQCDELGGMYWYLQYLANIRLQHLQRIRTFTKRRASLIETPTREQTDALSRSFSFLTFSMIEASATQSFADALSCLYISLAHLSLVPSKPSPPYSTPQLRYSLRMRPFLPVSIPAVPSYEEFNALIDPFSIETSNTTPAQRSLNTERLHTLLESAELATKIARKEWDAVSKSSAETARCQGCEKEWRAKQKDVLRSVIVAGIAIAGVKKWVAQGTKRGKLVVEIEQSGYHDWWIVPKVKSV
ncbi:hypothetical protein MMC13_006011 [Lambiella insularis]|nr:hypothetical protein [Lambiella insularis]